MHADQTCLVFVGVGKTMSHALLAQALYVDAPDSDVQCPGPQCPGYKVKCWYTVYASAAGLMHASGRTHT